MLVDVVVDLVMNTPGRGDAGGTRMAIPDHAELGGLARIGAPMTAAGAKRAGQRDLNTSRASSKGTELPRPAR